MASKLPKLTSQGSKMGSQMDPWAPKMDPPLESRKARFEYQDDECRFISSVYDTI